MKKYIVALLLLQTVQLLNAAADDDEHPDVVFYEGLGGFVARSVDFFTPASHVGEPHVGRLLLGEAPVHWAIKSNSPFWLGYLIARKADLNEQDSKTGWTPLRVAVLCENTDCLRLLLAQPEVDVNLQDRHGCRPFHFALGKDDDLLDLFLTHQNLDVNLPGIWGRTPLYIAAEKDSVDRMSRILAISADALNIGNCHGQTPLHIAAHGYRVDALRFLSARQDVDVNSQDSDGNTPLHIAAFNGGVVDMLSYLTAAGADVNIQNADGQTPFHRAISLMEVRIIEFFLGQEGIALNVKDKEGRTPVEYLLHKMNSWRDDYFRIKGEPSIKLLKQFAKRGADFSGASCQRSLRRLVQDGRMTQENYDEIMFLVNEDIKEPACEIEPA